jgi:predicted Zn-dependent peptidase
MYTKQTLKNGLTILEVPIPSAKSVLVDIFIKTGSRQESARLNGISHFLEHMFYKGCRKYPTPQALSHALDAIGAEYNANTGKEHTQFYIKAAKKHFRFIFEVLTDMLQNPVLAKPEIEREKGVIIEEINMYEDTPMHHVGDVLEEICWPNQPLGRNIAGSKKVIKKLTRQGIQDHVQTFYQPKNMILGIGGSFDQKLLQNLVKKYWANLPGKKSPAWQRAKVKQEQPVFRVQTKKTEQQHLALGFRSYHYNHHDYIPQIVLAAILGGGMSSRLFTEIREKQGWAYYVKTLPVNYQDTGLFIIQAGIRLDILPEVLKTIMLELARLKFQAVPLPELTKAKEYLKGTLTLSLEESGAMLGWYLEQAAFRREILEPEEIFARIDRVQANDLLRVAQAVFQEKKLSLAVVGRDNFRGKIKDALRFPDLRN